jgi:hypothetical protein
VSLPAWVFDTALVRPPSVVFPEPEPESTPTGPVMPVRIQTVSIQIINCRSEI